MGMRGRPTFFLDLLGQRPLQSGLVQCKHCWIFSGESHTGTTPFLLFRRSQPGPEGTVFQGFLPSVCTLTPLIFTISPPPFAPGAEIYLLSRFQGGHVPPLLAPAAEAIHRAPHTTRKGMPRRAKAALIRLFPTSLLRRASWRFLAAGAMARSRMSISWRCLISCTGFIPSSPF